ncbi:MAG TPA: MauE/DoxX family redox-associated membrane protein [Thermoanaerobaculia bacterium]|jgi:hypothetical protein|nr:MauE/DoxX family redox-associated membrane protein [Thermoanaerobaculia bacterium]
MTLFLATIVACVMSAVLLWAALEKLRNPAAITSTIERLGFPATLSRPLARTLTVAELSLGVAVSFRPDHAATQTGIVLLAALFAVAALIALRLREPVPCNCVGAGSDAVLGARQWIALVPWLVGVAVVRAGFAEAPNLETAAAHFAAVSLLIATLHSITVWRSRGEARGDRESAREMYAWLPSH